MSLKSERKKAIKAQKQAEEFATAAAAAGLPVEDRSKVTLWYPLAEDLQLPDVPPEARSHVRNYLDPVLRIFNEMAQKIDIAVGAGRCWNTGQCLLVADLYCGGRLRYVEGVWTRSQDNAYRTPEDDVNPAPHAWNTYEGYIIDLIAEFYGWNSYGEDANWLHEPLREYSEEDLDRYSDSEDKEDHWVCVSSGLWLANGGRDTLHENVKKHLSGDLRRPGAHEQSAFQIINEIVFKDAKERLLARINSAVKEAA